MIDGGFRRGGDVLMAMALGARAVFIGRPFNYAGAVAGQAGVLHALAIVAAEIRRNMALLGVEGVGIGRGSLRLRGGHEGLNSCANLALPNHFNLLRI